jgi:hypothetical protein
MYRAIISDQLSVLEYLAEKEGRKQFIGLVWVRSTSGTSDALSALHVAAGISSNGSVSKAYLWIL